MLLLSLYYQAEAQKINTLPNIRPIISKQLLGIPAVYALISFELGLSNKIEVFKVQNNGSDLSAQASQIVGRAVPGDEIFIDNVLIQKEGKQIKWIGKTFVVQ